MTRSRGWSACGPVRGGWDEDWQVGGKTYAGGKQVLEGHLVRTEAGWRLSIPRAADYGGDTFEMLDAPVSGGSPRAAPSDVREGVLSRRVSGLVCLGISGRRLGLRTR